MELRVQITPASPFRLPRLLGMDGLTRRSHPAGPIERLLHDPNGEPVVVRVAQTAPDAVLFGARARTREVAEHGIARMRFALGVDDDLRPFYTRFRDDPLIGRSLRARPWLRVARRPEPFEALVWAISEQLIEYERAAAIQRRLLARFGRHVGQGRGASEHWDRGEDRGGSEDRGGGEDRGGSEDRGEGEDRGREEDRSRDKDRGRGEHRGEGEDRRAPAAAAAGHARVGGLRDLPTPATLSAAAPAALQSCDLAGARALAMRRAAREIAAGRIDLHDRERPERGWRRLRAIPGIGPWTVETLALRGQGRYEVLPAGDLSLLKLTGRILSGGDPRARAGESHVRELFAPYGEWAGLAAAHAAGL